MITTLSQLASNTRQLGRYLVVAPLVLGLIFAGSTAQAQVVPTPAPAEKPLPKNIAYYLDGQKVGQDAVLKVKPDDISYMQVLNGTQQQQIFGTSDADGTAVVTTKANANAPAVQALNQRIWAVTPLVPATAEQNAAAEAIKTYMAKNYPHAELQVVGPAKGQTGRYQAVFVEAGKRLQLLFDANGQPVQQ